MRLICLFAFIVVLAACNRDAVTQPTPASDAFELAPVDQKLYPLGGWVFDTAGRPIEGASVQILSGARAGEVATTFADGTYAFRDGFPAAPEMQASKSGYRFERAYFHAPGSTAIRKVFFLGSLNPPIDLGGTYDLTFTADPVCDVLPPEARSRRYLTTVPGGNATSHILVLSGASFVTYPESYAWNRVPMSVFENFVVLHFSDPPIGEKLDDQTTLYISGSAQGEITGSTSHLSVGGNIDSCHSKNHTLTLVRH